MNIYPPMNETSRHTKPYLKVNPVALIYCEARRCKHGPGRDGYAGLGKNFTAKGDDDQRTMTWICLLKRAMSTQLCEDEWGAGTKHGFRNFILLYSTKK